MKVDHRRAGQVVGGVCLVTLAVVVGVLFAAGANKNAQISELRSHGVSVQVTVSRCLGLIGGSGSNAAGYACWGSFTLGGHRYHQAVPGNAPHVPGARVRAVTVSDDPGLLSTPSEVATERPSWKVFILPSVLAVVLALLVTGLTLGRRRHRSASSARA